MSRHELDVATWAAVAGLGLMSRHHFDVATWAAVWAEKRGRDTNLMSRHGVVWVVSRHRFDVATWFRLHGGGLVSRPRFEVATWSVLSGVVTSI